MMTLGASMSFSNDPAVSLYAEHEFPGQELSLCFVVTCRQEDGGAEGSLQAM